MSADDARFAALHAREHEAPDETLHRCRRCGYVTWARPLDNSELWHYSRTGESRHGGCPMHPWGWHWWNTEAKAPPDYSKLVAA